MAASNSKIKGVQMSKIDRAAAALAAAFAVAVSSYNITALAAGPDGERQITVLVENFTSNQVLKLPDGRLISAHISPGMYAIVYGDTTVFEPGKPASPALERQAEDGSPKLLVETLANRTGVRAVGTFTPGEPIAVTVRPGDRLVFTTMFVQSNDLFYAPDPKGIALFDAAGRLIEGDATKAVTLWDAGTEVNEAPGAGPNQAPRQSAPDTGPAEKGVVRPVNDGFAYPAARDVVRVTIAAK
jgi:hypothetical protein